MAIMDKFASVTCKIEMTYDLALAAAKDAGNRQMKVNYRDAWNFDDYNLACRVLARLYPQCGANPNAGLAKQEA